MRQKAFVVPDSVPHLPEDPRFADLIEMMRGLLERSVAWENRDLEDFKRVAKVGEIIINIRNLHRAFFLMEGRHRSVVEVARLVGFSRNGVIMLMQKCGVHQSVFGTWDQFHPIRNSTIIERLVKGGVLSESEMTIQ